MRIASAALCVVACAWGTALYAQVPQSQGKPRDGVESWATWSGGLLLLANAFAFDASASPLDLDDPLAPTLPGSGLAYGVSNLWRLWPAALAATAVGTVVDRRAPRVALEMAAGVVAAAGAAEALKVVTGRARPRATREPFEFDPFAGGRSFPSGHATAAFAIAGAVAAETGNPWVRGAAFALASYAAWDRLARRAHWYSDVVAGAVLGTGMGYRTTRGLRGLRAGAGPRAVGVDVAPWVSAQGVGVRVRAPLSLTFGPS
jgi:membrane-associated phospholipid phosphatase